MIIRLCDIDPRRLDPIVWPWFPPPDPLRDFKWWIEWCRLVYREDDPMYVDLGGEG